MASTRLDPADRAGRLATAGVVAVIAGAAVFTTLVAGGSGRLELVGVRLVYDLMALLAVAPWLAYASVRPAWLPASRIWPAILAILLAFGISTLTSRAPRLSAEMFVYVVLLGEVYLMLVALMRRARFRAPIERIALALCVAVCLLYLLETIQAWDAWWRDVGRLTLPPLRPAYLGLSLGSPNPVATVALVLGAFAIATTSLQGIRGRAVAVMLVVLGAAVALVSGSRGAWLGAAAGLAVAAVVALVQAPDVRARARARASVGRRTAAVVAVGGGAVLVLAGTLAAASGRLTFDDAGYREAFAEASMRMFGSSPVTGTGAGTWQVLRAANEVAGQPDLYIPHAHSIYTQTLAEFGAVGIVAAIVVLSAIALLLARALRSDDPRRRRVALAAVFGVVFLAAQQTADMLMNVPAVLLAIALSIAWLDAAALGDPDAATMAGPPPSGRAKLAVRPGSLAAAAATVALVLGLLAMESVTIDAARASSAVDEGRWEAAATAAARAVASDPGVTPYRFTLGIASANAGDLEVAASALAASAEADDYPYAWLDLAAVRWQQGDDEGARTALARAERLGLRDAQLALPAGWLRERLGDRDAAVADDGAALAAAPSLADDPYWSSTPFLRAESDAILDAARSAANDRGLAIDLYGGRLDRARATASDLERVDPELYALVVPAWEGDDAAWGRLQALAAGRPLDGGPAAWCRVVALRRGDASAVVRYGRWLATLTGSDAALPLVARVDAGAPGLQPTRLLDRYGSLYRRSVPRAQVILVLPQVTWQDGL